MPSRVAPYTRRGVHAGGTSTPADLNTCLRTPVTGMMNVTLPEHGAKALLKVSHALSRGGGRERPSTCRAIAQQSSLVRQDSEPSPVTGPLHLMGCSIFERALNLGHRDGS